MYYIDTKPAPCRSLDSSEPKYRHARRGLGEALRRFAEALGATGHRVWEQRRFAGLARLSATAGWMAPRHGPESAGREGVETKKRGPRSA